MPRPRPTTRPRTAARVAATQALFQIEQASAEPGAVIAEFLAHRLAAAAEEDWAEGRVPEADAGLFAAIVAQAGRERVRIDREIAATLPRDWPLARLDAVLRALLRAAVAELLMPAGAPARVVISEYLDVAHGFFTGDEPKLVNGVLDRIAHRLRPAEFGETGEGDG
jgi:N utilization substance protein B